MAYIGRDLQYGVLDKQTLTGANSVKTVWNDLTYGVASASNLLVSVGGLIQEPEVAYTASGTILTFVDAPTAADTVYIIFLGKELAVATAQSNLSYQTGTGDGTDTTPIAVLNKTVPTNESIMVMLDGVTQVPGTDYSVSGTTLTFTTAPANGVDILVYFLGIAMNIGTPSDNTVTSAKIVDGAITSAKLAPNAVASGVPVGTILDYAGSAEPTGWVFCDGQTGIDSTSDTTFAALFAVIGTTYGGTGATDFDLPDLRGRVTIGLDNLGGVSANTIVHANADSLGGIAGTETHVLVTGELAAHTHTGPSHTHTGPSHTHTGPSHTHGFKDNGPDGVAATLVAGQVRDSSPLHASSASGTGATGAGGTGNTGASGTAATGSAGSGSAHRNDQPWMALSKIIKK